MLPLLVRLVDRETGVEKEAGFRRSPVRIGRNHLNDLTIDEGFVSQWHGIVRFDDAETRFLDVGSTNGTMLAGERLEKHDEVVVEPTTELRVGPLTLTFVRIALRDDQILSRRASAFRLGGTKRATTSGRTMRLSDDDARALTAGPAAAPSGNDAASGSGDLGGATAPSTTPAGGDLAALARRQRELTERLAPVYAAYAAARAELEAVMTATLDEIEAGADADVRIAELARQLPLAFDTPAFRSRGGLATAEEKLDVGAWLGRLLPAGASMAEWEDPKDAMERAGALLESFASAYVSLRSGQRQVMTQLAVEPGGEGSTLSDLEDSRELLSYLLDASASGPARMDEVAHAFADIALHQLGMLNGAIEGGRALLHQVSPHAIGAAQGSGLAKTSAGLSDYLWPFRAAANYYRFAAKHAELSSSERLTSHLFGRAFAKAYYRVTGSRSGEMSK